MSDVTRSVARLASPDDMERQFYLAMRHGDIERLMAVWADDEQISCIHPGGPRIIGAAAIRSSFEGIFGHGAVAVEPERVRRLRTHSTAVHSVVERIHVMTSAGAGSAWVIATNVYVKTGLGWRMVVHHASQGSAGELPDGVEGTNVLH